MTADPSFEFVFDASDRAVVQASGKDVLDLLQRISTNDLSGLPVGASRPTILLNEKGRIIEVITVFRRRENDFLLIAESNRARPLISYLQGHVFLDDAHFAASGVPIRHFLLYDLSRIDTSLRDRIDEHMSLLSRNLDFDTESFHFDDFSIGRTLYHLLAVGVGAQSTTATHCGARKLADAEEFQNHRIRLRIPFPNSELTDEFNPLEARLEHLVAVNKGCYTGQEVLARIDTYQKLTWKRINFISQQQIRLLPMILTESANEAGILTSCASTQHGGVFAGMGYLRKEYWGSQRTFRCAEGEVQSIIDPPEGPISAIPITNPGSSR